mmetsp:Transcript_7122/g.21972  ORF Transcript_7122/g.21972 Transcript_7122/m.21972 type:complete len:230 (+) Transcript_7122:741-1430(+)
MRAEDQGTRVANAGHQLAGPALRRLVVCSLWRLNLAPRLLDLLTGRGLRGLQLLLDGHRQLIWRGAHLVGNASRRSLDLRDCLVNLGLCLLLLLEQSNFRFKRGELGIRGGNVHHRAANKARSFARLARLCRRVDGCAAKRDSAERGCVSKHLAGDAHASSGHHSVRKHGAAESASHSNADCGSGVDATHPSGRTYVALKRALRLGLRRLGHRLLVIGKSGEGELDGWH